MLKSDRLQLRTQKNFMRKSRSIHVTTDNSIEEETLHRFDTLTDKKYSGQLTGMNEQR